MSTKYADRPIPKISLHDFDSRIDTITSEICTAAENVGFFSVINHGIPPAEIRAMFGTAQSFFALPDNIKATVPWNSQNVGWEKNSQIRPSTGAADMKESYQLQFGENMLTGGKQSRPAGKDGENKQTTESSDQSLWMNDHQLPGFRDDCLRFMHRVQDVSNQLMVCLARGLGFADDYFLKTHDPTDPTCQNVMRLLHYYATPDEPETDSNSSTTTRKLHHRAGAHADWGLVTLLFQQQDQPGLEICPGREAVTEFALGDTWTRVNVYSHTDNDVDNADDTKHESAIICNIGDMLMSWSDDRFQSTFHRVKAPCEEDDYRGDRYSIAFFNQPCKDAVIQGPRKKYPAITGREFIANAMKNNFTAKAKVAAQ
ncbi:hypothetical protein BD289DRAFT_358327 [Coniella lustricola]|uniref:Fe2OG dioxygenase domain-containing protein n=1 Tax=Coniella lustricola TaxID=2025994 RepID=A0A2T3ANR8_9PEZI|nr:hypothetical protein BD289DRAFT_358327 [Coniella lustricola]